MPNFCSNLKGLIWTFDPWKKFRELLPKGVPKNEPRNAKIDQLIEWSIVRTCYEAELS